MACPGASRSRGTDGGEYNIDTYARRGAGGEGSHRGRHLMTGVGAYFYIVWGIWLRHCLNYRQDEYELLWPNLWTMPMVVRRRGVAKKEL